MRGSRRHAGAVLRRTTLARATDRALGGDLQRQGGEWRAGPCRRQPELYTVRVDRVWKGDGTVEPGGIVLLAHPDAAIAVGDAWLCNRSVRHPDRPHPGRRLVVFSHEQPDRAHRIYDPIDEELFLETSHGLSTPLHLAEELSSLTFDELEDRLSNLVGDPVPGPDPMNGIRSWRRRCPRAVNDA